MKIATLNINSVNARLTNLTDWLMKNQPDIMMLQEIKTEFNNFPFFDLQMAGYHAEILGQKSYNGTAILSRHPMTVRTQSLPNFPDENARYLECEITINSRQYIMASLYLPNGNPPQNNLADTSKFSYKLAWMDAFIKHADELIKQNKPIILAGDFNVIMSPHDVYNSEIFIGNALFRPEVQNRLRLLNRIGYCDTYRRLYPHDNGYTFWDYTGGSLQNDFGMRIDYIFTSPYLTDRLKSCFVDKEFRKQEKASDHTILMAEFEDK
ncbi:MAG: exodeoxyribonuclease III [Alphaproteobacteria bacterium]|nr:exodeoxyribonuclease III [Alphaproteobacteria bacterium]